MEELKEISPLLSICAFVIAYILALISIKNAVGDRGLLSLVIFATMFICNNILYAFGVHIVITITITTICGVTYAHYEKDFGE